MYDHCPRPDHRTDQVGHIRIVVGRERELHKTPASPVPVIVIRAQLVVLMIPPKPIDSIVTTSHRVHGHGSVPASEVFPASSRILALARGRHLAAVTTV